MRRLADVVYLLTGIVYLPVLLYQMVVLRKNRTGWGERFGRVAQYPPEKPRVWVHAVSLGEVNATPRLIDQLQERVPDVDIVVSTTTDTGYARAVALYGRDRVFRFPLDFSPVVRRVLDRVQPNMIVLVELEVWYNLVRESARRGIKVAVVNGRLTDRSARRLGRLGKLVRPMFAELAWVGAQDETIADRFRQLGVAPDRIEVIPSLKWDSATVADTVPGADALARALGLDGSQCVWVCGSTGPDEEGMILDAYAAIISGGASARDVPQGLPDSRAPLQLVIVPRKPERFAEVAGLIERRGYRCVRRSDHPDGATAPVDEADAFRPAVILGDTMGELRKFYALADVVFIGRTLVPLGGSDPMEAAALGKPLIAGPHTENFRAPAEALRQAGALETVDGPDALARAVYRLMSDDDARMAMGRRAREVVVNHQGGTQQTVQRLAELLTGSRRHAGAAGASSPSAGSDRSAISVASDSP